MIPRESAGLKKKWLRWVWQVLGITGTHPYLFRLCCLVQLDFSDCTRTDISKLIASFKHLFARHLFGQVNAPKIYYKAQMDKNVTLKIFWPVWTRLKVEHRLQFSPRLKPVIYAREIYVNIVSAMNSPTVVKTGDIIIQLYGSQVFPFNANTLVKTLLTLLSLHKKSQWWRDINRACRGPMTLSGDYKK